MKHQYVPNSFYSKKPLKERVELIKMANNTYYWMLLTETCSKNTRNYGKSSILAPYDDNEAEMLDCCDWEDNYEINPTKSGKYITCFHVPLTLHALVIGPRGAKLREFQENTNTLIKVPKPSDESGIIKITGQTERNVASARSQILLYLLGKRDKMPISHFVSIPVCSREIETNFHKFKEAVLAGPPTRGIDCSIFQKPKKLHLTITTLTLLDDQEIEEAKKIIQNCSEYIKKFASRNFKPVVTVEGLEIMNDDPSDVNVLYGKIRINNVEMSENFQLMADSIASSFHKNVYLMKKQFENVKLHVTLMNSTFRKNDQLEKKSHKRESFDATYILDKFSNFYFGKTNFNSVHLSVRFTTTQDLYYESVVCINV